MLRHVIADDEPADDVDNVCRVHGYAFAGVFDAIQYAASAPSTSPRIIIFGSSVMCSFSYRTQYESAITPTTSAASNTRESRPVPSDADTEPDNEPDKPLATFPPPFDGGITEEPAAR